MKTPFFDFTRIIKQSLIGSVILFLGIFVVYFAPAIQSYFSIFFGFVSNDLEMIIQSIRIFGVTLASVGFGISIKQYLSNEKNSQADFADEVQSPVALAEIYKLRNEYKKLLSSSTSSKIDVNQLEESIKNEALSQLPESLLKSLELKYAAKAIDETQISNIRKEFTNISQRIQLFLQQANNRGNINLGIGGAVTFLGVVILLFVVLETKPLDINKDFPALLSHYIPRITTIIFIEIFAFFFLKLYRSNLQEIRFFQNELTNIELRKVAIETALLQRQNTSLAEIINQLAKTERNFGKQPSSNEEENNLSVKDINSVIETISKVASKGK